MYHIMSHPTTTTTTTAPLPKISSHDFYSEYSGHKVRHLQRVVKAARRNTAAAASTNNATTTTNNIIWTAGDSSLDNKYWFSDTAAAVGIYKDLLQPPRSKQDVTYWLNYLLEEQQQRQQEGTTMLIPPTTPVTTTAVNAAVEASTLNERTFQLRPQDVFLRDSIQANDTLIVSVGGNDVALAPLPCTICSIAGLLCCIPDACLEHGCSIGTLPCDDCCLGCGPSLCSCAGSCPPCLGYLRHLFGTRIQKYIQALTAKTKPAKILVCCIYYPDEMVEPGSWAGPALGALGYNTHPHRLQRLIRKAFQHAVASIQIPGGVSIVIPVPLYQVLDGKNTNDYVQRVEPSPVGGRKMAEFLLHLVQHGTNSSASSSQQGYYGSMVGAPTSPFIEGRG